YGGRRCRYRVCRRRIHDRWHRPVDADPPGGADVVYPGRPALGAWRRIAGCGRLQLGYAELSQWLPYLRGRDRPRHRRGAARPLHVVDDIGTVINPLLAKGQIHGGVAQGAGQALVEDVVYDHDSGQLLTGSLMDYGIPRADTLPPINIDFSPVPSTTNPLGAKGVGEGGTLASTAPVLTATPHALAPLGVSDVPMPATPERIWRAIRERDQS